MQTQLNASSRILYKEAQKREINCTLFNDQHLILMEKDEKKWYTRGSRISSQSSVGKTIADNKFLTKQVLEHYKLPTAKYIRANNNKDLSQLNSLKFPLVMKPVLGRHGSGVIVGIKSIEEAKLEFSKAKETVLFEEMLLGKEFRVVCIDFKFTAASFRKAAFVTGDGKKTISDLVAEKNTHPWRGKGHSANLTLIEIDDLVENYLKEQGHTTSSVPNPGEDVFLRKTANLSTGGEPWDVTEEVSKENKKLFEDIAKACDLNILGIDIMCSSMDEPIKKQTGAGVIEINSSPGLRMHHFPIKGKPRNVAGKILDMMA